MKPQHAITITGLLLFMLLSSFKAQAQSDSKIREKLEKLYAAGKFKKCEKLAEKYRSRQPSSAVPVYYLSRLAWDEYKAHPRMSSGAAWKNLRKASQLAALLPASYKDWKAHLRQGLAEYIQAQHDTSRVTMRPQLAVRQLEMDFGERHALYDFYFPPPDITIATVPEGPLNKVADMRREMILHAEKYVGIKYKYGGEKPETGFDCSGFVKFIYQHVGIDLPHNAHMQSMLEGKVIALEDAQPGDIIIFGSRYDGGHRTQHAGIFHSRVNGEVRVIHCVSRGVSIDGNNSSWEHYWKERVLFVKRLPDLDEAIPQE